MTTATDTLQGALDRHHRGVPDKSVGEHDAPISATGSLREDDDLPLIARVAGKDQQAFTILLGVCKRALGKFWARTDCGKPTVVTPLRRSYAEATHDRRYLLAGEYRIRLRGPISVDYLGRTTAQEVAILGDGRRLVFWAPETLVKLAIPKKIALGAAMVRSLDQVIDAETGRVSGIGAAIVMRREGLDQELYVHYFRGPYTSTAARRSPVASGVRLRMPRARSLSWICAFVRKAMRAEPAGAQRA